MVVQTLHYHATVHFPNFVNRRVEFNLESGIFNIRRSAMALPRYSRIHSDQASGRK